MGACRAGDEGAIIVLATKAIARCAGDKGVGARRAGDEGVIIVLATMEMGVCPVGNAGVGTHAHDDGKHGKNREPSCWPRGHCVFGGEAWAGCRYSIAET